MPRNLKRFGLTLRPVIGPAMSVVTVCVPGPGAGGRSDAGAAATLAVELLGDDPEATCVCGRGLASASMTLSNVKRRRRNDCISQRNRNIIIKECREGDLNAVENRTVYGVFDAAMVDCFYTFSCQGGRGNNYSKGCTWERTKRGLYVHAAQTTRPEHRHAAVQKG